jgi:hypothetical protein
VEHKGVDEATLMQIVAEPTFREVTQTEVLPALLEEEVGGTCMVKLPEVTLETAVIFAVEETVSKWPFDHTPPHPTMDPRAYTCKSFLVTLNTFG